MNNLILKHMNKQDLKVGEYYCWNYDYYSSNDRLIINKIQSLDQNDIRVKHWIASSGTSYYNESNKGIQCNACTNIRLATPEEKHWLNKCIELNKFITKEEAMESFIPEYVKCIRIWTGMNNFSILNKIYNTTEKPTFSIFDWNYILNSNMEEYFIPSTKEEYEAQNKPKETMKEIITTIDKLRHDGNIDIPRGTTFEVVKEFPNSYQVLKPIGYDIRGKYLFLHKCYFEPQKSKKEILVQSGLSQPKACQTCKYHNKCNESPLIDSKGICPASEGQHYPKDIIKQEPVKEVTVKLGSRVYSLDEISKIINANYEKEDALEIINTIKTIK